MSELIARAVLIGIGATAVVDLWGVFAVRVFGAPATNWGMFGRWLGHFPHGRFVHASMAQASAVRGELLLGWTAHYAIGIAFAALLLAICGLDWARNPTPLPALVFGLVTVAAPFFIMQPAMGAGIAAAKTPKPGPARLRSIANHGMFGVGLYVSALLVARAG